MVQVPSFKQAKLPQVRIDDVFGKDFKATIKQSKDLARGSVANLLKVGQGQSKRDDYSDDEEEEKALPARPIVRAKTAPVKSSVPLLDISDDVLDRIFDDGDDTPRRATSKFFAKQRQIARLPEEPRSTPVKSQAEHDRRPLDAEDVIYMFAGAPYFDVQHNADVTRPRVVFGWGPTDGAEQGATDCRDFEHKSFEACAVDPDKRQSISEVPDMKSANGREPGTIGLTHFLQLPLAQHSPETGIDRRKRLTKQALLIKDPESLGLREFDVENVADRVSELSKVYQMLQEGKGEAAEWDEQMIEEIGEDLFAFLLSGDLGTTPAGTGSVTLCTQIQALQRVLLQEDLWYDFSTSFWRGQIGQLLWHDAEVTDEQVSERDVLILQIALSAELAVRLEIAHRLAITDFRHAGMFTSNDLAVVLKQQSPKLDWDMVLFKRFARCFAAAVKPDNNPLHRLSFISSVQSEPEAEEASDLTFFAKNEKQQFEGLQAFASALGWTHISTPQVTKSDSFLTPPTTHARPSSWVSEYDTPLSSPALPPIPMSETTQSLTLFRESKLFTVAARLPEAKRGEELYWADSAWARSWFSGFVMPGASIQRCVMQALLEHSGADELSSSFGDGFVYNRQMYWCKESVAGRVLAPAEDVKEAMGWISLPFVPQGRQNGWMQIDAKDTQYVLAGPRTKGDLVARTSDPLHQHDTGELQVGDFTTPVDGHMVMGNEAQFFGVSLSQENIVNLTFQSPRNPRLPALTLPLLHAVHFVSSYPCFPYTRRKGTAPYDSCAATDSGHSTPVPSPMEKDLPLPPAHPLHVDFTYTIIPAAALLSSALPEVDSDALLLMDGPGDPSVYQIEDEEVVILDCRGSSDLEVLARAWCAKVGENALVGRKGRTCIACCVREAIGLGIGVVIRI